MAEHHIHLFMLTREQLEMIPGQLFQIQNSDTECYNDAEQSVSERSVQKNFFAQIYHIYQNSFLPLC